MRLRRRTGAVAPLGRVRLGEEGLYPVERLLGLWGPGEAVPFFEEFVKGHALLPKFEDEAAERRDASDQALDPLDVLDPSHPLDGVDC